MKLFKHTLLVALAALTLTATSCLDNKDDDEQTLESRPMMYYRIVDVNNANTTPYFYQSYGLLYFKSPAESFNAIQAIKLSDLVSLQFETGYLPLKSTGTTSIYTFSHSMIQTEGHQISALSGKVDYYGSIYMEFMVDGNYKVYATSTPLYNVTSTKVAASASDKPEYNTSNMYYGMLIDPTDHKATLAFKNFALSAADAVINELDFRELTVEITETGYHLTGTDITPLSVSASGQATLDAYKASEVEATITDQGRTITGHLTLNGHYVSFEGNMFP